MCQLYRVPTGGALVFTADCVEFTEDIFLLSSSQFRDMCSVPTVDAPLPGMEKLKTSDLDENLTCGKAILTSTSVNKDIAL